MDQSKSLELAESLKNAFMQGLISQEQVAEANRLIQVIFANHVISGVSLLVDSVEPTLELNSLLIENYKRKLQEDIEADIMSREDIQNAIKFNNDQLVKSLDLIRKFVQGKELLQNYPTLSDEERSIVEMLKSFKSKEEKDAFVGALKNAYQTASAIQPEPAPANGTDPAAHDDSTASDADGSSPSDDDDFELPE